MTTLAISSQTDCLFCGSATNPYLERVFDCRFGIVKTYDIFLCPQCKIEQTVPVPTYSELKNFYHDHYNFDGETDTVYTKLRQMFLNSWFYRIWLAIDGDISFHSQKGQGRLLDVGCNEGRGLSLYRANGFEVEGLEMNERAAQVARKSGYAVSTESLDTFHPAQLYDKVVLSNVLEHSLKPQEMLQDIRRILKPGGEVWISCPNNSSWLRPLCGRYWINWHVPFHIVHFSEATLRNLLRNCGFEVKTAKQETPALWVAQSLIAWSFSKRGKPTRQLRNPFLVVFFLIFTRLFLFPLLWLSNRTGFGDCLVVIARKA